MGAAADVNAQPTASASAGAVAISGDTLVVGRHEWFGERPEYWVFVRNGGTWTLQAELIPSGCAGSGDRRGASRDGRRRRGYALVAMAVAQSRVRAGRDCVDRAGQAEARGHKWSDPG